MRTSLATVTVRYRSTVPRRLVVLAISIGAFNALLHIGLMLGLVWMAFHLSPLVWVTLIVGYGLLNGALWIRAKLQAEQVVVLDETARLIRQEQEA